MGFVRHMAACSSSSSSIAPHARLHQRACLCGLRSDCLGEMVKVDMVEAEQICAFEATQGRHCGARRSTARSSGERDCWRQTAQERAVPTVRDELSAAAHTAQQTIMSAKQVHGHRAEGGEWN